MKPLYRENLHYDWHFFYDTGNGDTGNRGVHTLDHTRWMIGCNENPARVRSFGGRFAYDDDGETPNTQVVWYDTKPAPIVWEMLGLNARKGAPERPAFRRKRTSMIIECEGGYLTGGRGGATAFDWQDKRIEKFPGDGGKSHQRNFIEAVRSRKSDNLAADITQGRVSTAFCHLALISHLTGYKQDPGEISRSFSDNALMTEETTRVFDHLKANEVDLQMDQLTLGADLNFDTDKNRFTGQGSRWANMYQKRLYSPPFVLPNDT